MKKTDPTSAGGRLRALRKARGLTLDQLAAELGYSAGHLTHMELNRYRGGRNAWEAIATYFRLPIDYFLTGPAAVAERQAPIAGAPDSAAVADDEAFAELAGRAEAMLREEAMPADSRTVARLARALWREVTVIHPPMPLADAIDLVLDEHRSKIARARAAIFKQDA